MKAKLIKRAALAAAILAGGMAYGDTESALQVVYCKATIMDNAGNEFVSVTLPPTEGYYDDNGNPLTYWNVGNVPAGGVADSWHGEGGPGRFTARNAGNVGAYFYVTTGCWYSRFLAENDAGYYNSSGRTYNHGYPFSSTNFWGRVNMSMFGADNDLEVPSISPQELRSWRGHGGSEYAYHLAFTTDTTAKVPTWHSLDHRYAGDGSWTTETSSITLDSEVAGYMGYVDAGDYLTFDLKFWAPPEDWVRGPVLFTFCVEASSFPLWDHGRAVE